MNDDVLRRLQAWYASQCDGEWEHGYGVNIRTLDNPGWSFTVSLRDTALEGSTFEQMQVDRTGEDCIMCRLGVNKSVGGPTFEGAGGAKNLTELLVTFLDWADKVSIRTGA